VDEARDDSAYEASSPEMSPPLGRSVTTSRRDSATEEHAASIQEMLNVRQAEDNATVVDTFQECSSGGTQGDAIETSFEKPITQPADFTTGAHIRDVGLSAVVETDVAYNDPVCRAKNGQGEPVRIDSQGMNKVPIVYDVSVINHEYGNQIQAEFLIEEFLTAVDITFKHQHLQEMYFNYLHRYQVDSRAFYYDTAVNTPVFVWGLKYNQWQSCIDGANTQQHQVMSRYLHACH
jgi:hypothetical protein